jgi:lipopolysaccharide export system protein LptA
MTTVRFLFRFPALMLPLLWLCVAPAAFAPPAFAQAGAQKAAADAPVEITADKELEWNRAAKTYTARGRAVARQGGMQVKSHVLTAHYDGGEGLGSGIRRLVAEGDVVLSSPPYTGYGARAVYDLGTGIATLTGKDLRIETPAESLAAQEKIEFDVNENRLTAIGKATARRGTDSLSAERLSAYFLQGADGKTALQRIVADTPVTIRTARETATGDRGVYDVSAGKATLTGRVRILQGENWLEGTRAEVDLNTGISRLFGTVAAKEDPAQAAETPAAAPEKPVGDGRVRGVFYPRKKEAEAARP